MPQTPLFQYQQHTEPVSLSPESVSEDRWHFPWSTPVWTKQIHPARMGGEFNVLGAGVAETVFEDKWHFAWSEPVVKIKIGLSAGSQQVLAFQPFPITSMSWFTELSKPQRLDKPGLGSALQQTLALQPTPIISIGWFTELSKPQRLEKPGLLAGLQQTFAFSPLPLVSFAWFAALAEPVRVKLGLLAGLQQFFTADTAPIPVTKLIGWFASLSEPVRIKPGLKVALQQFLAWPSQLRPTPTTTAVLNALETPDTLLSAVSVWDAIDTGEVGVVIITAPGGTSSVAPANTASPIAYAKVSIVII